MDPGPPITSAVAIPAMFPVPTLEAIDIIRALNADILAPEVFSETNFIESGKNLSWANFILRE
jgi:hypothetical protein